MRHLDRAFRGLGAWVDLYDYPKLDPEPSIADMHTHRVRTLYLQTGRWNKPEPKASDAFMDPALELRDANGALIKANDNWRSDQQAEIAASSIAPTDDNEPAVVWTLTPGNYTTIVRGKNSTTGVAIVEAFLTQ